MTIIKIKLELAFTQQMDAHFVLSSLFLSALVALLFHLLTYRYHKLVDAVARFAAVVNRFASVVARFASFVARFAGVVAHFASQRGTLLDRFAGVVAHFASQRGTLSLVGSAALCSFLCFCLGGPNVLCTWRFPSNRM